MEIFVFGSNTAGIHGAGAAKHAHKNLGAVWGIGEGRTGNTYALPTKTEKFKTSAKVDIIASIGKLAEHAASDLSNTYVITPIGCGLAGLNPQEVKSWIKEFQWTDNVVLNRSWFDHL